MKQQRVNNVCYLLITELQLRLEHLELVLKMARFAV
jgi:hypothetical protein